MHLNEFKIKSKDGSDILVTARDMGEKSAKGAVIICHGFGEHSGGYKELLERLAHADYIGVIFDQRGHGKLFEQSSEKRKKLLGVIPGYHSFMDDIDAVCAFVKDYAPNTPLALYGHSMGGNIAANYLLKNSQTDFFCAVLESPWFGLNDSVNPPPGFLIKCLSSLFPNLPLPEKLTKLQIADITRDEAKQKEIEEDALYHNRMTLRMFSDILDGCAFVMDNAGNIMIPVLVAYAKGEKIVSNKAIQTYIEACGQNVNSKEFDSRHSIHNDNKREDFYNSLIKFLDDYCKTP